MKKLLFLIPFLLYAGILSGLKEKELNLEKNRSIKDSSETKKSWVSPLIITLQREESKSKDIKSWITTYSISVNQPIFKSGAIYYSIKYSDIMKKYNLNQIKLKRKELIKAAYDLVYEYNIAKLNEEILRKKIKNAQIDVLRKEEAFKSGTLDSSFLDNAILNLNNLKLSLEDLKFNLVKIKNQFSNISNLDINSVNLPIFKIIKKDEFLKRNLELIAQKNGVKMSKYMYKMKKGNELITIYINANYAYQEVDSINDDKFHSYNIGIGVKIPISINSKEKIQKAKIDYLKSKVLLKEKEIELINTYQTTLAQINSLNNKQKIYQENLKIYSNLIKSTKEAISAGEKTDLDLEVLENSRDIMQINLKILNLQIQKALLELYSKLQ